MELTAKQLAEFSSKLDSLKVELDESILGLREMAKPVAPDDAIGRVSRMDSMQQQKMAQTQLAGAEARLRLIAGAKDAITRGEYGVCRVCEEFIGVKRLSARPESLVCVTCQTARGG